MHPDFVEPRTIGNGRLLLASGSGDSKLIARGTAVVLMLQQGLISSTRIVSINRLKQLDGISTTRDGGPYRRTDDAHRCRSFCGDEGRLTVFSSSVEMGQGVSATLR